MYGQTQDTSVNVVQGKFIKKMVGVGEDESLTIKSKIDVAHLPPCKKSLIPHVGFDLPCINMPMHL